MLHKVFFNVDFSILERMDRIENSFDGIERNVILCFMFNLEFTGLESFFLVP